MRSVVVSVSALVCVAVTGASVAEPEIRLREDTYPVIADSWRAAYNQVMYRQWAAGGAAETSTEWTLDYRYRPSEGRCELYDYTLVLDIVVLLPEWENAARASASDQQRWQTLRTHLRDHEHRHIEIALEGTEEMERAIAAVRSEPDCTRLRDALETTKLRVMDRIEGRQNAYDRRTDHGQRDLSRLSD